MTLGQGQGITLTLNTHVVSFTHLAHCIYQFSEHRLQVSEKYKVLTFSNTKVYANKFDLRLKWIEGIQVSSFEQTMIGSSPQCYILSFMTIGLLVREKIFEGFLPYMGMAAILVMWLGPT